MSKSQGMTQSEIDALLKDSDFEDSQIKQSRLQELHAKVQKQVEESNEYGTESFENYEESKSALRKQSREFVSESQGYGDEEFESYEESRRTKDFERSKNEKAFQKRSTNLNPIMEERSTEKKSAQKATLKEQSFKKVANKTISEYVPPKDKNSSATNRPSSSSRANKMTEIKENKHLPYKFDRLQQRQKELMFTSLSEENKRLKLSVSEKDKEIQTMRVKYNILLEEKSQTQSTAKETVLQKKLSLLQEKYNALLKEKGSKERNKKAVSNLMMKTMGAGRNSQQDQNMISEEEANEREQELLEIIQKLKERLVSSDKELKTLQTKMNEGLDYQQELQRKLKRVEQLDLRIEKMKGQAEEDRGLIEFLKEKANEQKTKIQELKQERDQLHVSLKRAENSQLTQSDILQELKEVKREKQLLQQSLRDLSSNFKTNLQSKAISPPPRFNIQDSTELLDYKPKR